MTGIASPEADDWATARDRLAAEVRANRTAAALLDVLEGLLREPELVMASFGRVEIVFRRLDPPAELWIDTWRGTVQVRHGGRVAEWPLDGAPPADAADALRRVLRPGRRWLPARLAAACRAGLEEEVRP